MNYVLTDQANIVTATRGEPSNGYVEAPDNVQCGWQLNGQTWEKGAALVAAEAALAAKNAKQQSVANMVATARQWKVDADTAVAAWDGQTTAQRFAACKILMGRFGTMSEKLADLIEGHLL